MTVPMPAAPNTAADELSALAATHGRFAPDGNVFVTTDAGEVNVGQYAAGTPEEGFAFFIRKYVDLRIEIDLTLTRLRDGRANVDAASSLITRIRSEIDTPKMVGDFKVLEAKAKELEAAIESRKAVIAEQKAKARAEALLKREAMVDEAEKLANSTSWKATGDRFKALLDEWKAAPRSDRAKEQELWKRFSAARSTFDKARRTHFAKLDADRNASKSVKSLIIDKAEQLASSTDWNNTANTFRDLMNQWKNAPRGTRSDEDALWKRFRAAQDAFFEARTKALAERDVEFKENLVRKEALAAEAEALLPIVDVKAFKQALRSIQERWEKIGHVPRNDKDRVEGRLRKVEEALRNHEKEQWRRSDPQARDRATGIVEQFRNSLASLEKDLEKATSAGDARKSADLEARIATTKTLLAAAENAASEFTK